MAAAGTSVALDKVIACIDGVLVQAPGGKIDVMSLVRPDKAGANAADPSVGFIYSNGHSNGVASSNMGAEGANTNRNGNANAVLRNNHQRYLIYKDFTSSTHKRGGGYRTRVVAAIGPDGKTFVRDYRDVTATVSSYPDNSSLLADKVKEKDLDRVKLGDECEPTIRYYLSGITDRELWRERRGGFEDDDAGKKDSCASPVAEAAHSACGGASRRRSGRRGDKVEDASGQQKRLAMKRVSPYHTFLRLFMQTNAGQGPSFKDAAEHWRGLTKEQQAQYVATPSQFEAVESQNFVLGQHKDGILTQEQHLSYGVAGASMFAERPSEGRDAPPQPHVPLFSQPEAVLSAEAVAIGHVNPVDTVLTAASPSKASIVVKSSLRASKRGRKGHGGGVVDGAASPSAATNSSPSQNNGESLPQPTQLALASQASAGPTPSSGEEVLSQQPVKKRRSERRSPHE